MSEYNQAIDDIATFIDKRNGDKPCGCIRLDEETGFWQTRCDCSNYDDNAYAASWAESANVANEIRKMRK